MLEPDITVTLELHSFGKEARDFEIIYMNPPELTVDNGGILEIASEDLGDYGDVSAEIHEELWDKNQSEKLYTLEVNLYYKFTRDYFGDIDTEVDYDYKVISIENC